MKLTEAYTVFNNNLHSMDSQLAEAIDRILDDKNKKLEKLDQVELAEVKARMEIERLSGALEEIESSSAGDYDLARQLARQALAGESNV